jgi:hypothetical protein
MPSIGIISQTMPVSVISQVMRHIIGIIIMGIIIGMLPIIGFIMPGIGMPIIGFIMPPIMVGIGIGLAAVLVIGNPSGSVARGAFWKWCNGGKRVAARSQHRGADVSSNRLEKAPRYRGFSMFYRRFGELIVSLVNRWNRCTSSPGT